MQSQPLELEPSTAAPKGPYLRSGGSLFLPCRLSRGFPGGSDGESICPQLRIPRFDPWVGKIPWRRKWQPTPVLLPWKSHGQRSLVGYSPWGHKESDMTERLHFHFHRLSKGQSWLTIWLSNDINPMWILIAYFTIRNISNEKGKRCQG